MPSAQDAPRPDDSADRDDAFARAFAPPPEDAPPTPYGGAYAPPAGDPWAPPSKAPGVSPVGDPWAPPGDPWGASRPVAPPNAPPQGNPWGAPGVVPPGAYAPYGAHGWGAGAPYAVPGHPGWQPPGGTAVPRWNGYAITALVLGVVGGLCCLWAGAIGFGIAALRDVRQRGERGRGMAITGIVLGGVWAVALAVFMVAALLTAGPDREDGGYYGGSPYSVPGSPDLKAGDCFVKDAGSTEDDNRVTVVDCAQPHYGEVFVDARSLAGSYPGKDALVAEANEKCHDQLPDFAPDAWALPADVDVHFFYPDQQVWDANPDRHHATCFLTDGTQKTTGSLKQDPTSFTGDQAFYLSAEHHVDQAFVVEPDGKPADHPDAFRQWSDALAVATGWEADELDSHSWDGKAPASVHALVVELRAALPHLAAAKGSKDVATLQRELAAAEDDLGYDRPAAVRAELKLAADPDRGDSSDGSGDSGDSGGSGGTGGARTNTPAPVLAPDGGRRSAVRI